MDKSKKNMNNPEGHNGYYGLHKQCMLVNKYYEKFDKPVFGEKTDEDTFVIVADRHAKDIHVTIRPFLLNQQKNLLYVTPLVDGWNFINTITE